MPITISQYAACVNNLAALDAILRGGGLTLDLLTPPRFRDKPESDAWISAQVHSQYYTSLPVVSLREAAHVGSVYAGRRLRSPKTTVVGSDLSSPEPIEGLPEADTTTCSASFFLEGSDFEVLKREASAQEPERTDDPENTIFYCVTSLCDSACALYPSVTVELLMVLCGSYQLHIEIERRADDLRRRWWAPGWNRLTERRCRQGAHRIQEHLNHHLERLSLLLPPDHPLLAHDRSRPQRMRSPFKVAHLDDNKSSEAQKALLEVADNPTAVPADNAQQSEMTKIVRVIEHSSGRKSVLLGIAENTSKEIVGRPSNTWKSEELSTLTNGVDEISSEDDVPAVEESEPVVSNINKSKDGALNWEDIEITFISEERVQIRTPLGIETRNYHEFGLVDTRTGTGRRGRCYVVWHN